MGNAVLANIFPPAAEWSLKQWCSFVLLFGPRCTADSPPSVSLLFTGALLGPLSFCSRNGANNHTPQGTPPLPLTATPSLASYAPVDDSYDFNTDSPHGSASSPSNSRPSTANSVPPPIHYATSMQAVDARDYPRWDRIAAPRAEAYATYYV